MIGPFGLGFSGAGRYYPSPALALSLDTLLLIGCYSNHTGRHMPRSYSAHRKLALETLENRSLMAGNVTASMAGSRLVIQGDGEANHVVLSFDRATQRLHVNGVATAGGATTINGSSTPPAGFPRVRQVQVLLGDGDDTLEVLNPGAADVVIMQYFSIDTGGGDDTVVFGRVGNAAGGVAPLASKVRTGAGINVQTGEGDDQIQIANLEVGGGLLIGTGGGDDAVLFVNEFTPAGESLAKLFPTRVRNQVSVHLGDGDDELDLRNLFAGGMVRVFDVSGIADISLHNAKITGKVDIDTGSGADEVSLKFVQGTQLTISTQAGADDVQLENCRFQSIDVKLGEELDTLAIQRSISRQYCYIDGGADGGTFTRGPGNLLRGLRIRRV